MRPTSVHLSGLAKGMPRRSLRVVGPIIKRVKPQTLKFVQCRHCASPQRISIACTSTSTGKVHRDLDLTCTLLYILILARVRNRDSSLNGILGTKLSAIALLLLPAAILERWLQLCRFKITFGLPQTKWVVSIRTNSNKRKKKIPPHYRGTRVWIPWPRRLCGINPRPQTHHAPRNHWSYSTRQHSQSMTQAVSYSLRYDINHHSSESPQHKKPWTRVNVELAEWVQILDVVIESSLRGVEVAQG